MNGDKKLIYFLVAIIILFGSILLIRMKTTPKYDSKIYEEIYNEYEDIFGENDETQEINNITEENDDIQENNNIIEENNNQTTVIGNMTSSNTNQGNIIGKIIIPEIDIRCPIIKETTTEYLEIAPTKYCGPDVNEVRQFSYSRS